MCPPFRDALCFDFKVEWLLEINYMPSSPKMLRNCGDFFCALKERRHSIKRITLFN